MFQKETNNRALVAIAVLVASYVLKSESQVKIIIKYT